jgi:hypothetical protein
MESYIFKASRWTRGNHLFRTIIEITENAVIRRKRRFFSREEISIGITKVASVHIKSGFFWSDIILESTGGTDPLLSHGHSKHDANLIKQLIMEAQGVLTVPEKLKLP